MFDLDLGWGGDFASSETGDLAMVGLPELGTQRVIRRLLTNPGTYLWHPGYGAGLAQYVGLPVNVSAIEALVRSQMLLEAAVAATPEPIVTVQADQTGSLFVQIRYVDADSSASQTLGIELPR